MATSADLELAKPMFLAGANTVSADLGSKVRLAEESFGQSGWAFKGNCSARPGKAEVCQARAGP